MKPEIKISLIGSGKVATQLGKTLFKEGFLIAQVYSQSKKNALKLSKQIEAQAITDIKKLNTDSSIYIIAVKDDAIEELAKSIKLKDKIIVHTSGTVAMDVLKNCSTNYGVFYPLQTFSLEKEVDFKTIPICIEANNKNTTTSLSYFAKSICNNVQKINSEQRKIIHLAAVFACNFSNHLYAIASVILEKNNLSFDILKPLIEETATKIKNSSPLKIQTGPAIRGDKKTMEAHLKLLSKQERNKKIYKLLSKNIVESKKVLK